MTDTDWDVFLSHSSADRAAVKAIARRLRDESGLRPFLDRWHLVPGQPWQADLAAALDDSGAAAIFIGPKGLAPWHNEELQVALNRAVAGDDEFRVIPVLLPGVDGADVPPFLAQRTWVDFRPGLDDVDALRRLAAAVRGEAIEDGGYELPDDPTPYRGLLSFDRGDAAFFFGRARDTTDLVDRVATRRFVAVVGASGSGKSSLVRAGLLPNIEAWKIAGSDRWHVLVCTPGSDPFRALARQVANLADRSDGFALVDDLTARISRRHDGLRTVLGDLLANDSRPVLFVVDQFEELFTLCAQDGIEDCRQIAGGFVTTLADVVNDPASRVRVVVTLRADFLGPALQLAGMKELLADPVLVGPLDDRAAREVIAGPAKEVGALLEKGLVTAVLRDVQNQQGALPLLQHALLELWHRRRGPWLTLDAYDDIGRVGGALAHRADTTYASLSQAQQHLARLVLLRLITLGEGVADTRRRVKRDELYPVGVDSRDIDIVLQALSAEQARLIVVDEDTVEISHEALIHEWSALRGWLEVDREAQRVHRRLTHAAAEWAGPLNREPGALYRGAPLVQAEEWARDHRDELNATEVEFLDASRKASANEVRRLRLRLYAAVGALVIALIGITAAIIAFREATSATEVAQNNLEQARQEADRADLNATRAMAQQARVLAPAQPELALAVAAEALARRDTAETREALQVAQAAYAEADWRNSTTLTGHTAAIVDVGFSPNGDRVATASEDGTAGIWDTANGEELITLAGHDGSVIDVVYGPNGDRVATASTDGTAGIWNVRTGERLATLTGGSAYSMSAVAFRPDGDRLATASNDWTTRIWDAGSGEELATLTGHADAVGDVEYSPNGDLVATASSDGTARIWDAGRGEELARLTGHTELVGDVVFAPDGGRVATASSDGTARIWDADSGEELATLTGHTDGVVAVVFAPDGDRVATASFDGTARIWDAGRGEELARLTGHTELVGDVVFAPDGGRVATASSDGTARIWDADSGEELATLTGHAFSVVAVAFAPDGGRVATASSDGTARIWDAGSREELATLTGHTDGVVAVVFAPDGDRIATASRDRTAKLWDADNGEELATFTGHADEVVDVVFGPDGDQVATASRDGTAKIWDADNGEELATLTGHADGVMDVAYSPDGDLVATAGFDGTAKIWDADNGEELTTLTGHTNTVNVVVFGPDGDRVATASSDATAKLWDAASGEELAALTGHGVSVEDVAFAPDGQRVATASEDEDARIWDAGSGEEVATLTGHIMEVVDVVFAPGGERVATASPDQTARIWDVDSGEELIALTGHTSLVLAIDFGPDGDRVATASSDATAKVWDAASGEELTTLTGHTDSVVDVVFSPDGNRLATASDDKTAFVYRPIETAEQACALIRRAVTAADLQTALAGGDPIVCTNLA